MHVEGKLHFPKNIVEVPRLETGRGHLGIAVHRVAHPEYDAPGALYPFYDPGQHTGDFRRSHPRDEGDLPRLVCRVQGIDESQDFIGGTAGADLHPHRILYTAEELDMRAVDASRSLADPGKVRRQIV